MTNEPFADVPEENTAITTDNKNDMDTWGVGVHSDIPEEKYHKMDGVSKSGLWKIYKQTPAHFKYEERVEKDHFDFGHAVHYGILQPELFEKKIVRGPADRRGNKWKDLKEYSLTQGQIPLVAKEYDNALAIRDAAHANSTVNSLITGGSSEIEHSGIWKDKTTDVNCRCRPDLYRPDIGLMVDLKSTVSASPEDFAKSVVNFGYHAQEAFYSDGYEGLGRAVDGFIFIAWEKKSPYAFGLYELPPSIVAEGREIMRRALDKYAECEHQGVWPGYNHRVQELSFKPWSYNLTMPPRNEDEV